MTQDDEHLIADRAALAQLVRKALRFSYWAAGEGLCPLESEGVEAPEDFLFECGDPNWETLADRVADAMVAPSPLSDRVERLEQALRSIASNMLQAGGSDWENECRRRQEIARAALGDGERG